MGRKEKLDLLLSIVPEEKKEAFIAEFREAAGKDERIGILKKYDITFSEEERAVITALPSNEVSDEELDTAAGGCTMCRRDCHCEQNCYI